ncbi:hypothetical protein [Halospeciosus flavus]|uniref:Histidine kinase n=1 Tax=Halospeciosus flavus TaxID=3032283 RepID=A0ABD5Z3S7_9EURY|nr:hypothetical protein [Halospeciosus flavus]
MPLEDVLAHVREREKTLTVYAPTDDLVSAVRERFATRNLTVDYVPCSDDEPGRIELIDGGARRESLPLSALEPLVDDHEGDTGTDPDPAYTALLDHVDATTLTLDDPRQRRHARREVEDRAWRRSSGRLVAGFQSAAAFDDRRDTYRVLGDALDVHVYVAGPAPEPLDGVDVHSLDDADVTDYRFVAYDGGGDETKKSAFLAETGVDGHRECACVLTYEPELVDDVFDALGVPNRAPP